ncbi:VOC family protein [Nitriliruptoraceae bacterium ZYF776]|nr:VOC family protein [Profundirhabdus halotolerans]
MNEPRPATFRGGPNIALKIPKADYDATLRFYRSTLGMEVQEVEDTGAPTVTRTHLVDFGPIRLWLDQVDGAARSDVWLEVRTDDLEAAAQHLTAAGSAPRDEIEPLESLGRSAHWIRDPAGVVHLLSQVPAGR